MSNRENAPSNRTPQSHPLRWHPRGGWCKRLPGEKNRTYYGKVPLPDALKAYYADLDARRRGSAQHHDGQMPLRDAANAFLTMLDQRLATNELGPVRRARYGLEIDQMITCLGGDTRLTEFTKLKAPDVIFSPLRKRAIERGLEAALKHVECIRAFLDWCSTKRRYMAAPFYADAFDPPSAKARHKNKRKEIKEGGARVWSADEIRQIIAAAKQTNPHFYAQVLLVLNGGFGQGDIAALEDRHIDWKRCCIRDAERSKTLVDRVCPLWPETIAALKASRALRPDPASPEYKERFFLTRNGLPLVRESLGPNEKGKITGTRRRDSINTMFYRMIHGSKKRKTLGKRKGKVRKPAPLQHLARKRAGFYSLRACFRTLAVGSGQDRDLIAIIMGQKFGRPIDEYYIRDDQRAKLEAITRHVHDQIFSNTE